MMTRRSQAVPYCLAPTLRVHHTCAARSLRCEDGARANCAAPSLNRNSPPPRCRRLAAGQPDTPATSTKPPLRRVHGSFCGLLDPRSLREATANFKRLDTNGDGKLSLAEFRHGLGLLGLSPSFATILFNAFDKSRDGAIDSREFVATMAVMLHPSDVEAQAALAFEAYDLNGDGRLDKTSCGRCSAAARRARAPGLDAVEEAAVDAAADSLLALMDVDGKGHVALDDYRRIVRDHPEELRRAGLGVPTRRRRSTAAAAGASRRLGGGAPRRRRGRRRAPQSAGAAAAAAARLRRRLRPRALGLVVLLMIRGASRSGAKWATARTPAGRCGGGRRGGGGGGARGAGWQCCGARGAAAATRRGDPGVQLRLEHTNGAASFDAHSPDAFRSLRACFGISEAAFMRSLGPEQVLGEMLLGTLGSLAELLSDGKSGSFFYFSNDGRYLIKTVPLRELTALLELLPDYTRHVRAHPHSLLPRFCGAFTLRLPGAGPSHFVALNNVFGAAEGTMHRRYDLKGSTVGRSAAASGGGGPAEEGAVLKDNDLARPLRLARASALEAIGAQVDADVSFLAAHGLMDYSLLAGVSRELEQPHTPTSPGGGGMLSPACRPVRRRCRRRRAAGAADDAVDGAAPPSPWADRADGGAEGAVAAADGTEEAALAYFGLIDVLTKWRARKAAEHVAKAAGAPAAQRDLVRAPAPIRGALRPEDAGVARRAGRRRARRVGARHAGARHAGDAEAARPIG